MKKTIVLGASPNPARYAYHAVRQLIMNDLAVIPVGIKGGNIEGINIETTPLSTPTFIRLRSTSMPICRRNTAIICARSNRSA